MGITNDQVAEAMDKIMNDALEAGRQASLLYRQSQEDWLATLKDWHGTVREEMAMVQSEIARHGKEPR